LTGEGDPKEKNRKLPAGRSAYLKDLSRNRQLASTSMTEAFLPDIEETQEIHHENAQIGDAGAWRSRSRIRLGSGDRSAIKLHRNVAGQSGL
jgi:hypothetical protein